VKSEKTEQLGGRKKKWGDRVKGPGQAARLILANKQKEVKVPGRRKNHGQTLRKAPRGAVSLGSGGEGGDGGKKQKKREMEWSGEHAQQSENLAKCKEK